MKCPKCQFENPDDTLYCGKCASPLQPPEKDEFTQAETFQVPKEELTTGTTFAGRYQIIEEIGKGGMGKVYKVLDKEINTNVALKLIKPEIAADEKTIERFRNELKTAREITHKNVCRMHDLNKEEGSYYITMEYVPGEDLRKLIRQVGQLTSGKAISIAKQICEGLTEAHRLGVVHRDLKPQNIMVDEEGNARIMDFGIARSIKAKEITDKGVIIGTPEYMSPEQVEGKGIDHRSDIYSLGIILYEMVTGKVPFEGDTPLSIAVKHKSEIAKDPKELNPQIPEDLSQVILKCMEKKKGERYQSVEELLLELKIVEEKLPTTEKILPGRKPTTSKEITVTFRKRWLLVTASSIVVIIAGISILYFIMKGPAILPEPEKERKMLAVLPFENLGPPEDEYFSDGITEEIMSRLAGIHQLGVIARTSSMQYKKTDKPISQIAEELGIDYILEGTVRWQQSPGEASRVRVTPQLIRVSDSTHIWSEMYDEVMDEVFQVQSDIAMQVVDSLDIVLLKPERQFLEAAPTDNLEAYHHYLRGILYQERSSSLQDNLAAEKMYKKAIELDPTFALAHAHLSSIHSDSYWFYYDRTEERLIKAKSAADKAFQLNPDLPEARLALGQYYYHGRLDYDHALEQFTLGLKKQPNNSELFFMIAAVQRRQGKLEDALMNFKKAFELNPRSSLLAYNLGETFYLIRSYPEAEYYYDLAISLNPLWFRPHAYKAILYLSWEGNIEKAREALKKVPKIIDSEHLFIPAIVLLEIIDGNYQEALNQLSISTSEVFETQFYFIPKALLYAQIYGMMNQAQLEQEYYDSAREILEAKVQERPKEAKFHSALGIAYAGLGRKQEAIREVEKAVELLPVSKEAYRGAFLVENLARVYVMVGKFDDAIDQLEFLLSIPSHLSIHQIRFDPVWIPLRSHPRFQKLIQEENNK